MNTKKILMAVLFMLIFSVPGKILAMAGDGTEESPFLITDQGELEMVTDFPDCHFKLVNDIVLEGTWVPLCTHTSSGYFTGVFDGGGYTISNLLVNSSEGGLFYYNNGVIKNLKVVIAEEGMKASGGIVDVNKGTILNCSVKGNILCAASVGGICRTNSGTVENCSMIGNISGSYSVYAVCGICASNSSSIKNCYFTGTLSGTGASGFGIAGNAQGNVSPKIINCYSVPAFSSGDGNFYGISKYNSIIFSFYDKTVSGSTIAGNGTPKSTAAMKMKKTYTDAGWDFDTVWGIDENINDGYPYLLWEYSNENTASVEIIGATSTEDTLKFISEATIEGEPEITTFGTTFIPLWLFEAGSADVATVEYENSKYNITNGQTYGATLTNIPESCKNMDIVGKSYIKDADGMYIWSAAKYSSAENPTLNSIE